MKTYKPAYILAFLLAWSGCDTGPHLEQEPVEAPLVWEEWTLGLSRPFYVHAGNRPTVFVSGATVGGTTTLRSQDGWQTWDQLGASIRGAKRSFGKNLYRIVGGVHFSRDEGDTWFDVTPNFWLGIPYSEALYPPIFLLAGVADEVYIFSAGKMHRSFNEGVDWEKTTVNFYPINQSGLVTDRGTLLLGIGWNTEGVNILRSTDQGTTWQETPIRERQARGFAYRNGIIYVGGSLSENLDTGEDNPLWISKDDGETWVRKVLPAEIERVGGLVVTHNDEIIIGATVNERVRFYRSQDEGQTWTIENTGLNQLGRIYRSVNQLETDQDDYIYAYLTGDEEGAYGTLLRAKQPAKH